MQVHILCDTINHSEPGEIKQITDFVLANSMERKTSVDINEQIGYEGLFGVVPGSYGPAICWDMEAKSWRGIWIYR